MFAVPSFFGFQKAGFGPTIDPDAQAFFDRVTAAGGTLSATEQTATNQLVLDMKAAGIWTAMRAVYPMVGASAAACAQNLKSSSFTGSFTSGWTFASTGVTPNGTSAFFDTTFVSNTNLTVNNASFSVYVRNASMGAGTRSDFGAGNAGVILPLNNIETINTYRAVYCWDYSTGFKQTITSNASGMWGSSRSGATSWQSFERNTSVAQTSATTQTTLPNISQYLGAYNFGGTPQGYSFREIAFSHCGEALSNTQFNNFYTAVQAFQTTLSRQV
jgi:hypothetical protein